MPPFQQSYFQSTNEIYSRCWNRLIDLRINSRFIGDKLQVWDRFVGRCELPLMPLWWSFQVKYWLCRWMESTIVVSDLVSVGTCGSWSSRPAARIGIDGRIPWCNDHSLELTNKNQRMMWDIQRLPWRWPFDPNESNPTAHKHTMSNGKWDVHKEGVAT